MAEFRRRAFEFPVMLTGLVFALGTGAPSHGADAFRMGIDREAKTFSYQNPIPGHYLRDPFILKVGDYWYRVQTQYNDRYHPPEKLPRADAIYLYKSPDLINWAVIGPIVTGDEAPEWARYRWWAPELFHDTAAGKFYFTINCTFPDGYRQKLNEKGKSGGDHGPLLMVADKIDGKYRVLTKEEPLLYGNDAHFFRDEDGKTYVFSSGIQMAEVDLPGARLLSPLKNVLPASSSDAWDYGPGVGREGPGVIKRNGVYYLFYSSWGRGYEVGIATTRDLNGGTWTLQEDNPVYGAQTHERCNHFGKTYTQHSDVPFGEVGHGQPFVGPDGRYWLSCHAIGRFLPLSVNNIDHSMSKYGLMTIDPITFDEKGRVEIDLTWTPQTIPIGEEKASE